MTIYILLSFFLAEFFLDSAMVLHIYIPGGFNLIVFMPALRDDNRSESRKGLDT